MRGVKVDVDDNVDMYLEFTFTMKTESTFRPLLSDAEQQLSQKLSGKIKSNIKGNDSSKIN